MTRTRFSKEHLPARLERFHQFLQEQKLSCYLLPQATGAHPSFIVYRESALMQVVFNYAGGIEVVGLPSSLRETVLGWIRQEQPHYRDLTAKENARKDLERYRFLLASSQAAPHNGQAPDEGVALTTSDHPLVEVVTRLGYQIHLFPTSPRYRLLQGPLLLASGEHLTDVVVALFEAHTHDAPSWEHATNRLPVVDTSAPNEARVSLTDLSERLPYENLELSCVLALPVRLQLCHPFTYRDALGRPQLEQGYVLELKIPPVPDPTSPFKPEQVTRMGGDDYLFSEVVYPSRSKERLTLQNIVRATGIDPTAKIWSVRNLDDE